MPNDVPPRAERRDRLRRFLIWMPVRLVILVAVLVAVAELGLPEVVGLVLVALGFGATALLQHRKTRA